MMSAQPLWTAPEAAAATGGVGVGDWAATGVSIDTRTVQPGDLFVALRGPSFDGHDFAAQALAKGAAAVMVDRPPPGVPADAPQLAVDETLDGLTSLAHSARLRTRARIVAVTGSVGKTGTKEALRLALEDHGSAFANAGSLNNHWGVPLSLARMPADTDFAAFELGMNHAGEIAPLSRLVRPDVSVITTVEAVHIEFFDSVEGIADAKAEIFAGMASPGAAVLYRDNPHFARLVAHARTQGLSRIWSFGEHPQADARLLECWLHATCSAVSAVVRDEPIQYSLPLPGRHWVENSLAVLLAVKALGGDIATAARALTRLRPIKGRGAHARIHLTRGRSHGSFLLIDESYNASPVAVAASLRVLGAAETRDRGRRIAVLGDMLELGEAAADLHRGLKQHLLANDIDLVFACGPLMAELYAALPLAMRGAQAADSESLKPLVVQAVRPGDVVMIKGSLGSRMAPIVEALRALHEGPNGDSNGDRDPADWPRRAAGGR